MAEEAVKSMLRRRRNETIDILDDESFNVSEARGKLSRHWDIACFDKGTYKLVRVCLDCIGRKELEKLLRFNDSPFGANTILQFFFWEKNGKRPACRPKLFYNQPSQEIPEELKIRVK